MNKFENVILLAKSSSLKYIKSKMMVYLKPACATLKLYIVVNYKQWTQNLKKLTFEEYKYV